jgi:hypothetical protein
MAGQEDLVHHSRVGSVLLDFSIYKGIQLLHHKHEQRELVRVIIQVH